MKTKTKKSNISVGKPVQLKVFNVVLQDRTNPSKIMSKSFTIYDHKGEWTLETLKEEISTWIKGW